MSHAYSAAGGYGAATPNRWTMSPATRRKLQRQDYYAALMRTTERLEDRTLLSVTVLSTDSLQPASNSSVVTISDFGNNYGLIVGAPIDGLLDRPFEEWTCETHINGEHIGTANASGMPGGPVES